MFALLCLAVIAVNGQGVVRTPKMEESVQVPVEVPVDVAKCSEETWEAVPAVKGYGDYRLETIGQMMTGFTVMITQHKTTLNSRCFATSFHHGGDNITMTNVYPTGEAKNFDFKLGPKGIEVVSNSSEHNANVMIAGASENFTVMITCNPKSEHLNVLVTYTSSITGTEMKTINNWLKKANFPVIGKWGAINFDTCSLTKTYVCNGGRSQYCSSVTNQRHRGHPRNRGGESSSSSEECDEEDEMIFLLY